MPAPQSGSGDTAPDSRRASLRRLSSIASLTNFFGRRRSTNITAHTSASSSSNLSLSSAAPTDPAQTKQSNIPTLAQGADNVVPEIQAPPATHDARRSSYVCLPDDPIGGMPRSRTFSNLPLPSRNKKPSNMVSSTAHSRLPSGFLPSSRLPSPQMTTRKYSHSRLMSAESKIPPPKNRMTRSDTEPLLGPGVRPNHLPRSTAFKENISLSPVKPLPALDMSDYADCHPGLSSIHSSSSASWEITQDISQPFQPPFHNPSSSWSVNNHQANFPAIREYKSSPVQRSVRDRRPTPLAPFSRFNSQPVLTSARRDSQHHEVMQTRLMSVRQPPTPPSARTPLAPLPPQGTARKKNAKDITPETRQDLDKTSLRSRSTGRKHPPNLISPPQQSNQLLESHTAESPNYWSGRLCALLDRYRNEELNAQLSSASLTPKSQMDQMYSADATYARVVRAFESLHGWCRTQPAKDSLTFFQCQYADLMKIPELRKLAPIVLGSSMSEGKEESGFAAAGGEGGISESRKLSFMDRLLGRPKRKSLGAT